MLFLGASPSQVPPIRYAKEKGYKVITCDNVPTNPGHKFADKTLDISTTDMEAVLQASIDHKIDGIVAYASDPAAPTAAFVGNEMGLPSNPYPAVLTLTDKSLFRTFLKNQNFNMPRYRSASSFQELNEVALSLKTPLMLKPVDSSGSKGVSKVDETVSMGLAFENAMSFSRKKRVIVEEFIVRSGNQIAGDAFIVDGEIVFYCLGDEHFDLNYNLHVPMGETFPTQLSKKAQIKIIDEVQRLVTLLGMKIGALNIDVIMDSSQNIFLIEVGPRNGGNLIPEVIKKITGTDLIAHTVDAALGMPIRNLQKSASRGFFASYILHTDTYGVFKGVIVDKLIKPKIIQMEIYAKPGDQIYPFNGSHCGLGSAIISFNSASEMRSLMPQLPRLIKIDHNIA